jgi:DNA-binding MarR family transcriptional regulator
MFAAMAALLRSHQMVVSALETELKGAELTLTSYLVLATLLMSRDETRPLGQLSKHLMVHPTSVTLVIDQLEKRGLVKRSPHPSDRRIVLAKLTPTGRRLTIKASKAVAGVNFGLGGLELDEAHALTDTLRQVRQKLGDPV